MAKFLKFEFDGIGKYTEQLAELGDRTTGIIKAGIYDGADIAVGAVKEAVREAVSYDATGSLENSVKIAKMEEQNGYIYAQIIFAGYDDKGSPQAVKARVLERGRSDQPNRVPTHFCSKAIRKAKTRIENAMDETINDRIEKIMKS